MDIKSLAIAHGEKVALGVVGAGCLVWLYASVCEISNPMGPTEEEQRAVDIVGELGHGSMLDPKEYEVPKANEAVKGALAARGMVSAELAQMKPRCWYVVPPKGARQVQVGNLDVPKATVRLKAAWPPPAKLDAKVSLGAVAVTWGVDEEAKHGVPVRFVVMRKKSAEQDWQQLSEVPAGEAAAGQWGHVDMTVSPKTKYDYRVQAVGAAAAYPETAKDITVVEPPEGVLDMVDEKPFVEPGGDGGETRKPRLLWFSKYSETKSVTTPRDVDLYLAFTSEEKANIRVMKFDPKKGWQKYDASEVAVNQKILGTRKVLQEKDGVTERVDETVDSDCKLLEIYDQVEMKEIDKKVRKQDPATGRMYTVVEKVLTPVRVQKLKVIDLTLNEEFWALSVKDKEPPAEGSGAVAAGAAAAQPAVAPQQPAARSRTGPAVTTKVGPPAGETSEEADRRRARETMERVDKERADRAKREQEFREAKAKATDEDTKRRLDEEYLREQQQRPREMPPEGQRPGMDGMR